ncbi:uncharacterized protein BX664DRAFT_326712 [Halteromyces radiatus]|uniref:uncharacterized protein n=1 Tax=Halteromyces radiatus TaxID=101107 RepID=UPI0022209C3C|nr:uncharacterized protein BX664DRAFT_326712 [Halteromyces radiatus]KAI8097571.1 hypothetical protein BX664DRAFT_326712 [Halteromyces radiatus]
MTEKESSQEYATRSGRTTGSDIGELQQKISKAEKELVQLRLELDQTRQQGKQAELHALESGRTNRKLKAEIQTLTDMSNRKDRQAENAKATAFFFEGQVKKYTDEIESARQGMGHLKLLDDELREAKEEQQRLEKQAQTEYEQVKLKIQQTQEKYKTDKEELNKMIAAAYQDLVTSSDKALKLQQQVEARLAFPSSQDIVQLEKDYKINQQEQLDMVNSVHHQVNQLKDTLEQSEKTTQSHEETMATVRQEMDRIMRRLRAIDTQTE